MHLKFDYRRFYVEPSEAYPKRTSSLRPVIPIVLINGIESIQYLALIDSGADFCLFHASIGKLIGLPITSGKKQPFGGIASGQCTAYFHNIKIEVGGHRFDCWAGFSPDIEGNPYGILGQIGFFDLFDVDLDYLGKRIELKQKQK